MEITIEIVDRNYEQIKEFCDFNNIKIEDYIVQCTEDDFFTRKYGDLNEKLNKQKEEEVKVVKEQPKEEETPKVEKKKVGRPKKKVEEEPVIEEEKVVESPKVNTEQFFIKKEETVDTTNKELQKVQTRIKRTLKTK